MITIHTLLQEVKKFIKNKKTQQSIQWAYNFAFLYHKNQKRYSGEPYIVHPLWTAMILAEWRMSPEMIIAGLLHDVLEDTPVTYEKLTLVFGEEISQLVSAVTKVTYFAKDNREQLKSQYLRKLYLAMAKDIRVIIIKMADRLHNVRTISYLPHIKQYIIAKESLEIYASIAQRLGMTKAQHEFEDRCFKIIEPDKYQKITEYLQNEYVNDNSLIKNCEEVIKKLIIKKYKIPCDITGRLKSAYSIYNKMLNQGKQISEIHDILAIRIITNTKDNCYLILGHIHAQFTPIKNRFKDYIATPKPNLYQSLHTTIVFPDGFIIEVQIRTKEMDQLAAVGIASHWKYKEMGSKVVNKIQHQADIDEQLDVFRHILDLEQITNKNLEDAASYDPAAPKDDEHQKLESIINKDVFSRVVYALTPNGKVVTLPYGARVIDFAYQIHSEVGDHTIGAKINGVMSPIATVINSGDVVEIKTAKTQSPNYSWLPLAKTSRARNKIRRYLRNQNDVNNELDKTADFNQKVKAVKARIKQYIADNHLGDLQLTPGQQKQKMRSLNIPDLDHFLIMVANGDMAFEDAIKTLYLKQNFDSNQDLLSSFKVQVKKPMSSANIIVPGLDSIKIQVAQCCMPIPNQDIAGLVTKTKGLSVHNLYCPSIASKKEKLVEVQWNDNRDKGAVFDARLSVSAFDRPGLVSDITNLLNRMVIPITKLEGHIVKNQFKSIFNFTVQVPDYNRLQQIINALRAIPDVQEIKNKGDFHAPKKPSII